MKPPDNLTEREKELWRLGFEEGVRKTLRTTSTQPTGGDEGIDISSVKLLRYAIADLPPQVEIVDPYGLPLRGEIADNYSFGKCLFVYGKRYRPITLGEPF